MSGEKEVKKYAEQIYEAVFHQHHQLHDSIHDEITRAGKKLYDMVKGDNNFESHIQRIEHIVARQPLALREYTLTVYYCELLAKVAPTATWQEFICGKCLK